MNDRQYNEKMDAVLGTCPHCGGKVIVLAIETDENGLDHDVIGCIDCHEQNPDAVRCFFADYEN